MILYLWQTLSGQAQRKSACIYYWPSFNDEILLLFLEKTKSFAWLSLFEYYITIKSISSEISPQNELKICKPGQFINTLWLLQDIGILSPWKQAHLLLHVALKFDSQLLNFLPMFTFLGSVTFRRAVVYFLKGL